MSNYWLLRRRLVRKDTQGEITLPGNLDLQLTLRPADLFGAQSDLPRTTVCETSNMRFEALTGKLLVEQTRDLQPLTFTADFDGGLLKIEGNVARLQAKARDASHVSSLLTWIENILSLHLSVEVGACVEVERIEGEVDGKPVHCFFDPDCFSLSLANVNEDSRAYVIHAALSGPDNQSLSYPRYIESARYYHNALRLVSPQQANYIPYRVFPEVLLNLCKSLESLFCTSQREILRKKFLKIGLTAEEIESQVVPIFLVRNELDIGHAVTGMASPEESLAVRRFIDRSIQNVAAILRMTRAAIQREPDLLPPVTVVHPSDRRRLVARLSHYLTHESLKREFNTPVSITCS